MSANESPSSSPNNNSGILTAVPIIKAKNEVISKNTATQTQDFLNTEEEEAISKEIVPLSSSLPSKLLRLHAKRSAQALLNQTEQYQSLDSQFGSDEGAAGGIDINDIQTPETSNSNNNSNNNNDSVTNNDVDGLEEKLIDVGMGSSIEDSEESIEEDDELKPLAVDNHKICETNSTPTSPQITTDEPNTPILSEANLEKFRKHHSQQQTTSTYPNMENIYLHPNFKYQLEEQELNFEHSPPPAVAPNNSPVEQKRVHRSFLTLKKPIAEVETANSIVSQATTENTHEPQINEIDALDPSLIPSDELAEEIVEAVEYYFSNDSILKDAFLLKHVRRNKEGFVSLKLVSSFKRVRQLTKEWRVVGNAVRRKSRKIELNELGTKVRRIEPLPNFDETMPSRTIVACDLPMDKLNIEKVSDIFSKCGEIALIRILKPGMAIPVDVRQFMNKYPEMQQKECALVEYLESSSARQAKNLPGNFQVFDMVAPKKKTGKKAVVQITTPVARMVENYRYYNDASYERTRGGSFSGIMPHNEDLRFKLRRNNSDFPTKMLMDMHYQHYQPPPQQHTHPHVHQHQQHPQPQNSPNQREYQFQNYQSRANLNQDNLNHSNHMINHDNNSNYYTYGPRRYSNTSTASLNNTNVQQNTETNNNNNNNNNNNINSGSHLARRLSNCSDTYSSSLTEVSRRPSNCSEHIPQRRDSNCSEHCACTRRISDFAQNEVYRKTSQSSIGSSGGGGGERRYSNGSLQFERTFSNASDLGNGNTTRRLSNDFNYERKPSLEPTHNTPYEDGNVGGGGGGYLIFPRRYSNNFNVSQKLAAYDNAQYMNGRRISTDSGYDRRCSFGSEYEGSPRSRTSSFLNNYKHGLDFDGQPRSRTGSFLDNSPRSRSGSFALRAAENLVRTPMGPDGSKGFVSRARKLGQTVSPVT